MDRHLVFQLVMLSCYVMIRQKRALWKLALVQELLPGSDDKVRAAIVRVPGTQNLLKRSFSHLIPLEISAQSMPTDETQKTKVECSIAEGNVTAGKLRRTAAIDGEFIRRFKM